jgi:hypothetical protein
VSALAEALSLLDDLGLGISGNYTATEYYLTQSVYDVGSRTDIDTLSFNIGINVGFCRQVDGYDVYGPGGSIVVSWGGDYLLQHFTRGSWGNLTGGNPEPILSVEDAVGLLTTMGEHATIGGIPPAHDYLLIDTTNATVGFYASNGEYETDILEPVYHFACVAVKGDDSIPCDIFIPNRQNLLRGWIDKPADGATFGHGSPILFEASSSGGSDSHTFCWQSDIDGPLGCGNPLWVDSLALVMKDDVPLAHTITLTVTDDADAQFEMTITLHIREYSCGDADGNGVTNVSDAVYLISYIFGGGPPPDPLLSGDLDCNGIVNVSDAVYLIAYIFGGGPPPCDPDDDGVPDC